MSNLSTYFGGSSAAAGGRTDQYGRVKPWCNPTVTRTSCCLFGVCTEPSSCLGGCMCYCCACFIKYDTQKVVPIGNSCFWVFAVSGAQRAHVIAAGFCLSSDGVPCQKTDFCCVHDKYQLSGCCCYTGYDHAAVDDGSGRAYIFWNGGNGYWCSYKIVWSSICWDTATNNVCVKCQVGSYIACDTQLTTNNMRRVIPISYGDGCNVAVVHRGLSGSNCGTIASVAHFRDGVKCADTCLHCWPQYDCQNVGMLAVGRKGSTVGVITTLCQANCWKFIEFSPNSANTASCRSSIFTNVCTNDIAEDMYSWDYIDDGSFGIAGGRFPCFCCNDCFFCAKSGYILNTGMGCKTGASITVRGCDSSIPKSLHSGISPCNNLFAVNCNYGTCNFGEIMGGFKQGIEATGYVSSPWFLVDQSCDPVKFPYRPYYDTTGAWQTTCILRRYGWDASGVFDSVNSMKNMAAFVDEYHMVGVHCVCATEYCMCFIMQVACFE